MSRIKRPDDPSWLQDYKRHVDQLAVRILAGSPLTIAEAVKLARHVIDEVDRQIDDELEQTAYRVGD
jgi:hypothetical protein